MFWGWFLSFLKWSAIREINEKKLKGNITSFNTCKHCTKNPDFLMEKGCKSVFSKSKGEKFREKKWDNRNDVGA